MTKAKESMNVIAVYDTARICHEANRALCLMVGDTSQLLWDDAPQWQRLSAIDGVTLIATNPEITSEALHNAWMAHKRQGGWVYGFEKDVALKTHPCMLPYDQLPEFQRRKDKLFLAIVRAML